MCTGVRFSSAEGEMFLGRNLDWGGSDYGEKVRIAPKGFVVPWAFSEAAPARHAVIGQCVEMGGYPMFFDCGNDAGLAIAGLSHVNFAEYPKEAERGKTNVAVYEFPLWVCANFATADEVDAALKNTALIDKPFCEGYPTSPLHWIIGDAKRSIVVESRADGLHVFDDPVDVITNQPEFEWHMMNLRTYITADPCMPKPATWGRAELAPFGAGAGMRGIPGDVYSPSRFVKSAYLNAHYPAQSGESSNVIRMFHILGNVSMVEGSAEMVGGHMEKTLYTSCFSGATGNYYFNTYDNPAIYYASLSDAQGADPSSLIECELRRD